MPNIRMLSARRELFEKEKLKHQGTIKARRNQESDTQDVAKKTNTSEAERTAKKALRDAKLAEAEEKIAKSKRDTALVGAVIGGIGAIVGLVGTAVKLAADSGKSAPSSTSGAGGGDDEEVEESGEGDDDTSEAVDNDKPTDDKERANSTRDTDDKNKKAEETSKGKSDEANKGKETSTQDKAKNDKVETDKVKDNKNATTATKTASENGGTADATEVAKGNAGTDDGEPKTALEKGGTKIGNFVAKATGKDKVAGAENSPESKAQKPEKTAAEKQQYSKEVNSYSQLFKQLLALGTNSAVNIQTDQEQLKEGGLSKTIDDIKDIKNGNFGKNNTERKNYVDSAANKVGNISDITRIKDKQDRADRLKEIKDNQGKKELTKEQKEFLKENKVEVGSDGKIDSKSLDSAIEKNQLNDTDKTTLAKNGVAVSADGKINNETLKTAIDANALTKKEIEFVNSAGADKTGLGIKINANGTVDAGDLKGLKTALKDESARLNNEIAAGNDSITARKEFNVKNAQSKSLSGVLEGRGTAINDRVKDIQSDQKAIKNYENLGKVEQYKDLKNAQLLNKAATNPDSLTSAEKQQLFKSNPSLFKDGKIDGPIDKNAAKSAVDKLVSEGKVDSSLLKTDGNIDTAKLDQKVKSLTGEINSASSSKADEGLKNAQLLNRASINPSSLKPEEIEQLKKSNPEIFKDGKVDKDLAKNSAKNAVDKLVKEGKVDPTVLKADGNIDTAKLNESVEASKSGIINADGSINQEKLDKAISTNTEQLKGAGVRIENGKATNLNEVKGNLDKDLSSSVNNLSLVNRYKAERAREIEKESNEGSGGIFRGGKNKFLMKLLGASKDDVTADPEKAELKKAKKFLKEQGIDPDSKDPAIKQQAEDFLANFDGTLAKANAERKIEKIAQNAGVSKEEFKKYFDIDKDGNVSLKKGKDGFLGQVGSAFQSESNLANDIKAGKFTDKQAAEILDGLEKNQATQGLAGQILKSVGSEKAKSILSSQRDEVGNDKLKVLNDNKLITGGKVDVDKLNALKETNPAEYDKALKALGLGGKTLANGFDKIMNSDGTYSSAADKALLESVKGADGKLSMDKLNALKTSDPAKYNQVMNKLLDSSETTLSNSFDKIAATGSQEDKALMNSLKGTDGKLSMEKLNKLKETDPAKYEQVMSKLTGNQFTEKDSARLNGGLANATNVIDNRELTNMLKSSGLSYNDAKEIVDKTDRFGKDKINKEVGGAKGTGEKANWFNMMVMGLNTSMPAIQFMLQQLDKMREAEDQLREAKKKKEAAYKLLGEVAKELKRTQSAINEGTAAGGTK